MGSGCGEDGYEGVGDDCLGNDLVAQYVHCISSSLELPDIVFICSEHPRHIISSFPTICR